MTDYRKLTRNQLDKAIMYQVKDGADLQKLDHLIAARGHKEDASTVALQVERVVNSCYKSKYC